MIFWLAKWHFEEFLIEAFPTRFNQLRWIHQQVKDHEKGEIY